MKRIDTPNNIEVLLHYHVHPSAPHPRILAPAVQDATQMLCAYKAIEPNKIDGGYTTTAKGEAWVKLLCNVAMPREAYIDENDNIIT